MKTLKINVLTALALFLFVINVNAQNKALVSPINKVISNYLSLKNTLITGDGNLASIKGKNLLSSLGEVPKISLSADQIALMSKMELDSRHISEVSKIAHQREHFASLSNNLYILVKKAKLNNIVLYHQYCTMRKVYFLSESEKGRDPYMGMDNCSKVTETLPAF